MVAKVETTEKNGSPVDKGEVLLLLWNNAKRLNKWIENPRSMPKENLKRRVWMMHTWFDFPKTQS